MFHLQQPTALVHGIQAEKYLFRDINLRRWIVQQKNFFIFSFIRRFAFVVAFPVLDGEWDDVGVGEVELSIQQQLCTKDWFFLCIKIDSSSMIHCEDIFSIFTRPSTEMARISFQLLLYHHRWGGGLEI